MTALAVAAPCAHATTTASLSGATLLIVSDEQAAGGSLIISGENLEISDAIAVSAGPGCSQDEATGHVLCPAAGVTAIDVTLGDGDDAFVADPATVSLPVSIDGGAGNDTVSGGAGSDVVHGGEGDDTVDAGYPSGAPDQLFGDAGSDLVQGWYGDDLVDGGSGADDLRGGNGADTLHGGGGDDTLRGQGDGDPLLDGGDGDDTLDVGNCGTAHPAIVHVVDGGPGSNTADLRGLDCLPYPYGGVVVSLDGVANDREADDPGYPMNVKNVTRLVLGAAGRDVVTGTPGDDVILGGGDWPDAAGGLGDAIDGGAGDDLIASSGTSELLDGGAGTDTVDFSAAGVCSISLDGVVNDGPGAPSTPDELLGFENAVGCGGGGTVTGNDKVNVLRAAGPSTLDGLGGDDVLQGGDGADTLNGGDGDDRLSGGDGADVLVGGADTDLADYGAKLSAVTVTLDGVAEDGVAGEGDDVRTEDAAGGPAADTITGDDSANALHGGGGDDRLYGGGGDDVLAGDAGADVLEGQAGDDTADYTHAGGPVTVMLDTFANDGLSAEGDNALTESVRGGAFADVLFGDGEANTLNGGGGADFVSGLIGDDRLIGGAGSDAILTGRGADVVLARDGEVDALTCDARAGKTITADAIDTSTTCDLTGTGSGIVPPPSAGSLGAVAAQPGQIQAGARPAAALAAAVGGLPRRGGVVRLGRRARAVAAGWFSCAAGRSCRATISVRSGRLVLARGTARPGAARTLLRAPLTAAGRARLRSGRRVACVLVVQVSEGAVAATVRVPLKLVRRQA